MSEEGKNILKLVKDIRLFSEQCSLLLRTSDELMQKKGWKAPSKTVSSRISQSVTLPAQWFPEVLFRFYQNNRKSSLLLYVSIILDDDLEKSYPEPISEPLVSAGCFDYGQGKKADKYEYFYAKLYGYMNDREDQGKIHISWDGWKKDYGDWWHSESFKCFGLPLVSVSDSRDLEAKIIAPLLKLTD